VDELRSALELATDDELWEFIDVLFRRRFNPLDYFHTPHPVVIQSRTRPEWIAAIEERFRFLAADGMTVLTGKSHQLSYRQILVQVCRYLRLPYLESLSTTELESEIFLHLVGQTWKKLPAPDRQSLGHQLGQTLTRIPASETLPGHLLLQPLEYFCKAGSVMTINVMVRPWVLRQLALQFAQYMATHQLTRAALSIGGDVVTAHASQAALQVVKTSMTLTAVRYTVVRTVLTCLGPALWTWLLADLGWRTISINYARILPMIFAIAQIRLTRSLHWESI